MMALKVVVAGGDDEGKDYDASSLFPPSNSPSSSRAHVGFPCNHASYLPARHFGNSDAVFFLAALVRGENAASQSPPRWGRFNSIFGHPPGWPAHVTPMQGRGAVKLYAGGNPVSGATNSALGGIARKNISPFHGLGDA